MTDVTQGGAGDGQARHGLAEPRRWTWANEGPVRTGSAAHRELFCRMLLDTFDPYKPAVIDWPELEPDALARLTGLPFWQVAVETEGHAAARITQYAAEARDPLIRDALELMAFEEQRHKDVLENMIRFYGIQIGEEPPYQPPPRAEWYFMRTGSGECLDSFFAFGLFELAKRSGFFPAPLVEVFEPVIQEEARHIVFFVNWVAYTRRNKPLAQQPGFLWQQAATLYDAGRSRASLGRNVKSENFTTKSRGSIGIDLSPRAFLNLCLEENERRMSRLDQRLLRPRLMPALVRLARPFLKR